MFNMKKKRALRGTTLLSIYIAIYTIIIIFQKDETLRRFMAIGFTISMNAYFYFKMCPVEIISRVKIRRILPVCRRMYKRKFPLAILIYGGWALFFIFCAIYHHP